MPYEVRISRRVRQEMARVPPGDQNRILAKLGTLAENPRPSGCVPVKAAGPGVYRVRVGSYRVIYTVRDDQQHVIVARVARRSGSTYRGLS